MSGEPEDREGADPGVPDPDGLELARRVTRATAATGVPGGRRPTRKDGRKDSRPDRPREEPAAAGSAGGPQPLSRAVERVVGENGWDLSLRVHGLFARWPELVGEEVALHSTPESFADGVLVVRTDSTAWATQLRFLAATMVARLNEELGHGTVIAVDVQGPHVRSWTKGPRKVRGGKGPRDTYG